MAAKRPQDDSLFRRRDEVIQHLIETTDWEAGVCRARPDDFSQRIVVADQIVDRHWVAATSANSRRTFLESLRESTLASRFNEGRVAC